MRNVIHDCPFVIKRGPRTATGAHFEDDAAEGPDVDGAKTTFVSAFDDFRGHIHGSARHGLLLLGRLGKGRRVGRVPVNGSGFLCWLEGLVLASYDFSGAKIHIFDNTVMIEKDVYGGWSELEKTKILLGRETYFQALCLDEQYRFGEDTLSLLTSVERRLAPLSHLQCVHVRVDSPRSHPSNTP